MTQKANKIKKTTPTKPSSNENFEISGFGNTMRYILGGNFMKKGTHKVFSYLIFLTVLAFIYIANNYYAEDKIRSINKLRKETKELRYEFINIKTELQEIEKQSKLEKKLKKKGIKKNNDEVLTIVVK